VGARKERWKFRNNVQEPLRRWQRGEGKMLGVEGGWKEGGRRMDGRRMEGGWKEGGRRMEGGRRRAGGGWKGRRTLIKVIGEVRNFGPIVVM
jgi:hypothetical protein